jgi:hypothetical protein
MHNYKIDLPKAKESEVKMSKGTYDKLMGLIEQAEEVDGEDYSEIRFDLDKEFLKQF